MKNIILGVAFIALLGLLIMKLMQPSIEGQWIADYVIDGSKDTLNIDASVIQLHIADDHYIFQSTLNHKEEGTIEHKGDHLIVQNGDDPSYKMQILDLSKSQATIVMNVDGIPRKLVMHRSD